MSSPNHNDRSAEQELDRHIAAMRDEPVEAGPSEETIGKTLSMLERGHTIAAGRRNVFERLVAMTFTQRIAAVVMLTLGALTLYAMFGLFNSLTPVAFADVANKFKAARTLQYNSTVTLADYPPRTIKTLLADPDRMRTEMSDGVVSLKEGNITLILDPKAKTAMRIEMTGAEQARDPGLTVVNALRKLGEMKGESIGEKKIDGIDCAGFKTKNSTLTMTVWANKKDASPVRVEVSMPLGPGDVSIVMDHFVLDAPLDEALFSLNVPEGYELKSQKIEMPKLGKLEDEIANLLKLYTDSSGGEFPASLVDWAAFNKIKLQGKPDPSAVARLGAIFGTLFSLPDGYGYLGKGEKVGDKDKIIFWYKPAGSQTYRAVFGDLHVGDATKDQLPATQPSKP